MPNINLVSSDGHIEKVSIQVALCSRTIKDMIENLGMEEGVDETVPLITVKGEILRKVVQWAEYHKDDPPPAAEDRDVASRTGMEIGGWDAEFLNVDQKTLFGLILAANYLDIKGLLDVTTQAVANMIKGKSPEEIRGHFHIKNDFVRAEEEKVHAEGEK